MNDIINNMQVSQMLITILVTFASVIFSFILWFGSERLKKSWDEKRSREDLLKEIIEEIQENVIVLRLFAHQIQANIEESIITVLGQKLNISSRQYSVNSGELRLIKNLEHRKLIRNSLYMCESFNHFVENTELLLAIANLKYQPLAIFQANYRLTQLRKEALDKAKYLEDIVSKLPTLKTDKTEGITKKQL